MVVVLMGVSGAGKTTIGRLLADETGWEFHDADDLHSDANKTRMASGIALTDSDRAPWLASIRELIAKEPRPKRQRGARMLGAEAVVSRPDCRRSRAR